MRRPEAVRGRPNGSLGVVARREASSIAVARTGTDETQPSAILGPSGPTVAAALRCRCRALRA